MKAHVTFVFGMLGIWGCGTDSSQGTWSADDKKPDNFCEKHPTHASCAPAEDTGDVPPVVADDPLVMSATMATNTYGEGASSGNVNVNFSLNDINGAPYPTQGYIQLWEGAEIAPNVYEGTGLIRIICTYTETNGCFTDPTTDLFRDESATIRLTTQDNPLAPTSNTSETPIYVSATGTESGVAYVLDTTNDELGIDVIPAWEADQDVPLVTLHMAISR